MITELLNNKKFVILDGAMGTELQRRGYDTKLPLWSAKANLDAPDLVQQIHEDNIAAGADIITTNTFRTTIRYFNRVGKAGLERSATEKAVELARNAAMKFNHDVYIAGSITTLEDCYRPDLVPSQNELEEEHRFQVELLASLGIDLLLIETINSILEMKVLCKYASVSGLPYFLSFVSDGNGDLLSGEQLTDAIDIAKEFNPTVLMLNCRPPKTINKDLNILNDNFPGHKGIYANGCGIPDDGCGWTFDADDKDQEEHFGYMEKWMKEGIKIIGGCCGTRPEDIKRISEIAKSI